LIVALAAVALGAPLAAFAQQKGKVWRVGFLSTRHVDLRDSDYYYGPFRQGMRELGYVDGKNLVIEWRSAEGKSERLPGLATELVNLKVNVIMTAGTASASAAMKATTSIPIVIAAVPDPVGSGLVKSLARPGGNITGLSNLGSELGLKHLEMLLGMVPRLSRLAVLVNPTNPSHAPFLKHVQTAAPKTGITILSLDARDPQEIENAFAQMARQKAGAAIVAPDSFFIQQLRQIADLAAKHRLPTISGQRAYAEAGGLMSYGTNLADLFRRAATYVDKIFKGAKPADLPVEQPTKFELFINGKTAKTLGLTIPNELILRADRVIE
jgi:putative ABC transport system substrate-binding protein